MVDSQSARRILVPADSAYHIVSNDSKLNAHLVAAGCNDTLRDSRAVSLKRFWGRG